jgi:phytoene dehydrogenase-like protein
MARFCDTSARRYNHAMTIPQSVDVAIIGGGHNGLVCANYLQRAGLSTAVFERRSIVGGAVCTEEIFPGYKVDVGSSVHIMVHQTRIVEQLNLRAHGLEYLPLDPWATYPLPDRSGRAICFYRDLERTCESIAQVSPVDARAYREFIRQWTPVARGTFEAFRKPPTMANLGRHLVLAKGPAKGTEESLRRLFTSYGRLIAETFTSPEMRAALGWLAAQSGPPPTEMASAPFVAWHAMIHETGAAHPRGGSGILTQALASALEAAGGVVCLNAPIERIVVEGAKAVGVEVGGALVRARAVVAACHVFTTFQKLLRPGDIPGDLLARLSHANVGNGFGATVRCASRELPNYGPAASPDVLHGMQLLCPSDTYLREAYADFFSGNPSRRPPVLSMTFSPVDDTLAPPGRHMLSFWSQYFPYRRADGRGWDDCADEMADSILETVYAYAPNLRGAITDRYIQTPLELERRLGLIQGNVMHLEMTFDQMFGFRPLPELSSYSTPIPGLYLSGASTHPGGGVFGASGINAAEVVKSHLLSPLKRLFSR